MTLRRWLQNQFEEKQTLGELLDEALSDQGRGSHVSKSESEQWLRELDFELEAALTRTHSGSSLRQ